MIMPFLGYDAQEHSQLKNTVLHKPDNKYVIFIRLRSDATMSSDDLSIKMEEYSQFVTKKLRPELERAEKARNETKAEMNEYKELVQRLTSFQNESLKKIETIVDLGHNTVYCNAVADLEKIFVHTGMGFHVEMTIPEAIQFVAKRLSFLETDVLHSKETRVREISDHIVAASAILDELTLERNHLG